MKFRRPNLLQLADLICGNVGKETPGPGDKPAYFPYRTSSYITDFFTDLDTEYVHDGTTRRQWVADVLEEILNEPHTGPTHPPETFCRLIDQLMDRTEAMNETQDRTNALEQLNKILTREGFQAFYAEDNHCYLRHIGTNTIARQAPNPHRPFTKGELKLRSDLANYLDQCTEDELIEQVLLPLLRHLGFQRITATGHKDKALEYGKDVWMRYTLPTQHVLYFGVQAKRGKLDAAGNTRGSNANVAEIYNQASMMLAHEIFDPETNMRVLVDHALIVAGGEITKQAKNWLGNALDASRRSQILFMDREDILNLYTVSNLPLPSKEEAETNPWDFPATKPPF